jgi:Integrase core domain
MRAEFLRVHDRRHATIAELQAVLDTWVEEYNMERPHQSLGMRPPIERFQLAPANPAAGVEVIDPVPVSVVDPGVSAEPRRLPGVQRWVDRRGLISLAGFSYRVPIVLAGEPVEAVVAEHLVQVFHRDVLVGR